MSDSFSRTRALLGDKAMEKIASSRVAVFGIGGVGGYTVEALARCGVGTLDLVDNDKVSESNINRQIYATHDTIGRYKTEVARERVLSINPGCKVYTNNIFFLPETKDRFDFKSYDYVVDAIDTVTGKLELIISAKEAGTRIISAMGAGNKLDATMFKVSDIYSTSVCPLARIMRKECQKRGIKELKVVYSTEEVKRPCERVAETGVKKRDIPGSVSFVPSVAGLIIAGEVVKDIIDLN